MEAHPNSGSPLEPFMLSQAVSTGGKRTRLHQTQSLFISGSGATKTAQELRPGSGLQPYGTGRLGCLQIGIVHFYGQPEPPDGQQAESTSPRDGKNGLHHLLPFRLCPALTDQRLQCAADCPPRRPRHPSSPEGCLFWDAGRASSSRNTGTAPASSWKCPKACTS